MTARLLALAAASCSSLVLATAGLAGIYVTATTPRQVHPGQVLHVSIEAGLKLYQGVPLYIVRSADALQPRKCGPNAVCEPRVPGPPTQGPYVRIGTVSFRKLTSRTVAVRIPDVAPGRYEIAFYCGPCYKGPGGSLVSTPQHAFAVRA